MRIIRYSLIIAVFACLFAVPALAFPEENLSSRLSGKILLDVDNKGEAWYVYPGDFHRYSLGSPESAYALMRNLSLGISNADFAKLASSTPDRLKGLILLKTEEAGKAYYVNPDDKSLSYMADASGAYSVMRQASLGIASSSLRSIPIAKISLDASGKEAAREWQSLGWWGRISESRVPAMSAASSTAKRLGFLYKLNTVKVLSIQKAGGSSWYQIDGGQYPGAYIESRFVSPIAQPPLEDASALPAKAKPGAYWTDLDISKKVLTLYKGYQALMATYVSVGAKETPTIAGTYDVWLKLKKARMTGQPPLATHAYDLADVPWVMYYKGSYSIHGTYWHDDFGTARSAGCTNVTQGDAKFIFDLTGPAIGEADSVRPSAVNPGLVVSNHY